MKQLAKKFLANNIALLIFAAVVVIGVTAVLVFSGDKTKSTEELLRSVQQKVEKSYQNVAADSGTWSAQGVTGVAVSTLEYPYMVQSSSLPSVRFALKEVGLSGEASDDKLIAKSVDTVLGVVISELAESEYTIDELSDDAVSFSRAGGKCNFTSANGIATLSCYSDDDVSAAAAAIAPFYSSLLTGDPSMTYEDLTLGPFVIKSHDGSGVIGSSHEAGYDIAELVVQTDGMEGGFLALFYKKFEGPWVYVTKAADEFGFSCKAMSATSDARKAFYDQVCLSEAGHIKLDTNNPALQ